MDFGLQRTLQLLSLLENPQKQFKVIHVSGTNGKGSTAQIIAHVLAKSHKTALFSTPHLKTPQDCIRINGKCSLKFSECHQKVMRLNSQNSINCTSFELLTVTAYLIFATEGVEIAVVEVGLGGTLDATNVFQDTIQCVTTSISLDHTEILGKSIAEIATHKAGIYKKECIVVIAPQQSQQALETLKKAANDLECSVYYVYPAKFITDSTASVLYNEEELIFHLYPSKSYLLENSGTAIKALETLPKRFKPTPEIVKSALESLKRNGRLEWVSTPLEFLMDGAHNIHGCRILGDLINSIRAGRNVTWVFGCTENPSKSIISLLTALGIRDSDLFYPVGFDTPVDMPWIKCADPANIRCFAEQVCGNVSFTASVNAGELLTVLGNACDTSNLVVVCGSLYLVSQIYRDLNMDI